MKNTFFKLFIAIGILSLASCEDYLDVNDSPNTPQLSQIPPNLLLSAAQAQTYKLISGDTETSSVDISTGNLSQFGNVMTNVWAGNSNNTTGAYANEYAVNMTSSFYDNIWDYGYRNITNLHNITMYNSPDYDNHKAIAKILKSFYMQYIVDLYGDCPYSEAFLIQENLNPKYEDDKVIYRKLVDQLDEAVAMISAANTSDKVVSGEDIMFGGNMTNWVNFANSVKLRLLIRQSDLTDGDTQTYINAELDELAGKSFITTDVNLNPGYNNSVQDQQNPFFATYGYQITGAATTQRSFVCASRNAANLLNGTVSGVIDPRRGRLFTLSGGAVVGINQGEDAIAAPDNASIIGPGIIAVPATTTTPPPGALLTSVVYPFSDFKFLLAEAALKYPTKFAGVNPQTEFEAGIRSSCVRVGVVLATANAYVTAINPVAGYGWTGTTNKIQAIMQQKYIANMNVNATESFIDMVRTGFPVLPLPLTNTTGRPKRLMYPVSEYTSNTANVPAQSTADAFNTAPFWKQ